jgi:hypothetical protein
MAESSQESAPVEVAAEPVAAQASLAPTSMPRSAALARSASAMGNQAFGRWAQSAGAAGEPLPSVSADRAWGSVLARDPDPATMAPGGDSATGDGPEPILVKGLQFGQQLLDGEIPETGGELSKTVNAKLGKYKANFGPYSLNVPLFPGLYAAFGAGGAMSANADASLTLAGSNAPSAMGSKKQEVRASGSGSAQGTIAGSLTAGVHIGVPGLANLGIVGQGTLGFAADGDAKFNGSIKRFKPKGENAWLPWTGEIDFEANVKGSLIASANGYFEYQVLWIYKDQFGKFKIGEWTLAEAGLKVKGKMKPGEGLTVTIDPWVGQLLKPGVTPQLRARTAEEREKAESLAQQGQSPTPVARMISRAPGDDEPPPAGGGGGAAPPADPAPPSSAVPAPAAMAPPAPAPAPDGLDTEHSPGGGGAGGSLGPDQVELPASPEIEEG